MKKILSLICIIPLFATTGCFFPGGRGGHWHGRAQADVKAPVVAVNTQPVVVPGPAVTAPTPTVVVAPQKPSVSTLGVIGR